MAVDDKFLDKYNLIIYEMHRAMQRGVPSSVCGMCEQFCDMVIKKSKLVAGPKYNEINIEYLCGMIPDVTETNRYYYLSKFSLEDNSVMLILTQHQNSSWPVIYKLQITLDDFNKFLTWLFSYVDTECSKEYLRIKGSEE